LNYFHLSCRSAEDLQLSRKWHATDISIACSARDAFSGEMAALFASLGNRMRFKRLDVAYQERDLGLPSLKTDFLLDSLRNDLRLTELVKRVGLP